MAGSKDNNHTKRRKGGPTTSSSSHIRFGHEEEDDGIVKPGVSIEQTSRTQEDAPVTSTTSASASSDNQRQKDNKRKRKHPSSSTSKDNTKKQHNTKEGAGATTTTTTTTNFSSCNKIFNGLILAISTLESKKNTTTTNTATTTNDTAKEEDDADPYQNYKTLKHHLTTNLGATISPQVHKRVHYLISTECAIHNLTQRVRQAFKRNVDIVDVAWVKTCIEQDKRVNVSEYVCNELVKCLMEEKELEKKRSAAKKSDADEGKGIDGNHSDVVPEDDNEGWSTPIQLDCCCVCHENGDLKCPWCTGKENECNLTLARMAKQCLPVKS